MSIRVKDISKKFGEQKALDTVNFEIQKGEITGFLGPNGAGKSTLMKILTTLLKPTSGEASVIDFSTENAPRSVQQHVGYLAENNPLYPEMYVREYLKLMANLSKAPAKRVDEVIEMTRLSPEVSKKIKQLSKGYKQRVGLAAALLHDPEVLILDEPTTGLDPNQLREIRQLIRSLGKDKTVLLSTHIMQEVEAMCDRVIIINKGKIVADRRLKELTEATDQLIEVEFDYRVEEVALQKLPHVKQTKNTRGFVYEITFETTKDMRPALFDFAHDNGLKTLQLNRKNQTLEQLFHELTSN
ncbi:gliding motility-associated ABC transporter ATP-binding subunit GldA [Leeuwenhoekiella parthenopeia]|uniref:Gliding motility-associated ABC transporter ATP-binding subunit GldA n=1 Tax=Leeuwenhoekiella parthenopeia TaxID=2890320 RepID=A0ABS8H007_9FLAO|nr:gliding motility-associated ABC transporter ATP-binding subunit GldA [Leeuwenhoekiella parthenopeia]MCC4214148.1 gliding motility-associated ABC transporter ATP-binding subunit GldA [Leeuwenhoekiella parthenopeia]